MIYFYKYAQEFSEDDSKIHYQYAQPSGDFNTESNGADARALKQPGNYDKSGTKLITPKPKGNYDKSGTKLIKADNTSAPTMSKEEAGKKLLAQMEADRNKAKGPRTSYKAENPVTNPGDKFNRAVDLLGKMQ